MDAYGPEANGFLLASSFCSWFRGKFERDKNVSGAESGAAYTPGSCELGRLLLVHQQPDFWYRCCIKSKQRGWFDKAPYEWFRREINLHHLLDHGWEEDPFASPDVSCEPVSVSLPISATEAAKKALKTAGASDEIFSKMDVFFKDKKADFGGEGLERKEEKEKLQLQRRIDLQNRLQCLETRYPSDPKLRGCGDGPLGEGVPTPCNFVDGVCLKCSKDSPGLEAFLHAKEESGVLKPPLKGGRAEESAAGSGQADDANPRLFPRGPLKPSDWKTRVKLYEKWPPLKATPPLEYAAGAYDVVFL
eukprot:g16320.t1